jgi:hypothetical protein
MEEELVNERRRLDRAPPGDMEVAAPAAEASIDALPDVVLQECFSFIGKGHYRYIAGTCHRFNEIYSMKHEKKTTWDQAVSSVSSAELFLQDTTEKAEESTSFILCIIFKQAVMVGNIKVLKWAYGKGHEPKARHFHNTAVHGHVAVLQWAEENDLDWFSTQLINYAARNGSISILEWIKSRRKAMPAGVPAQHAAASGHCAVLSWMKEHNLLGSIQRLWCAASFCDGHIDVLDWLFNNGYRVDPCIIPSSIRNDRRDILLWAREHDLPWDMVTCRLAVLHENLPMLQWLRENDCPWDHTVIAAAHHNGREDIAQWAIDNGCPTE